MVDPTQTYWSGYDEGHDRGWVKGFFVGNVFGALIIIGLWVIV